MTMQQYSSLDSIDRAEFTNKPQSWSLLDINSFKKILGSIKSGSSQDLLPSTVLQQLDTPSLELIMDLLNASIQEAIVPPEWKHAMILPLLKKANADPAQLSNFRPISLLPIYSNSGKTLTSNLHSFFNLLNFYMTPSPVLELVSQRQLYWALRKC